jgi:hypothetical protein
MHRSKIVAIVMLYLIGALGLHVQIHFCCGHLAALEWNPDAVTQCKGSENCCKKENCCSSITIEASIDDEHVVAKELSLLTGVAGCQPSFVLPAPSRLLVEAQCTSYFDEGGPPPLTSQQRLSLYQQWQFDRNI